MPNPEKPDVQKFQEQVEDLEAQFKEQFPEPEKMEEKNETLRKTAEAMALSLLKTLEQAGKDNTYNYKEFQSLYDRVTAIWFKLQADQDFYKNLYAGKFTRGNLYELLAYGVSPQLAADYPKEMDVLDIADCIEMNLKPSDPMVRKIVDYRSKLRGVSGKHYPYIAITIKLINAKVPPEVIVQIDKTKFGYTTGIETMLPELLNPASRKRLLKRLNGEK